MRFPVLIFLATLFVTQVSAVFPDEAYHVDYHYALLGIPKQDSTFFHRPRASSSASLLYTLSEKLVLGAVNPRDGSIVWRQDLSHYSCQADSTGFLRAKAGENTVISAIGTRVSAWDTLDGRLVWETRFDSEGCVKDLEIVDNGSGHPTVVVLVGDGRGVVTTVDGRTGEVKWKHADNSGDTPFQVSSTPSGISYVSLHSGLLKGYKIRVSSLDLGSKSSVNQYTLSSDSEVSSPESILFVGANTAAPIIVWADKGHKALKINIIGSKQIHSIPIDNDTGENIEKIEIHVPSSPHALSHFLVHYQTEARDWASVFHIDLKSSAVSKAYDLPKLMGKGGTFSTSILDANVYFTRITQSEVSLVSSASHGLLGRWPVHLGDGSAERVVTEVVSRGGSEFAVRFAMVTEGTWRLIRNGDLVWTRPEDLAGAVTAAWAESESEETLMHELGVEGHGNFVAAYIHRVKRHAKDLKHLPGWIKGMPERVLSSFGNSSPPSSFGFGKIVLVGTESGRVMAVDAGDHGRIVWNHDIVANTTGGWAIRAITVEGRLANVYGDKGTLLQLDAINGTVLRVFDGTSKYLGFVSVPGYSTLVPINADGSPSPMTDVQGSVVVTLSDDGRALGWTVRETPANIWEFRPPPGHRLVNLVSRPAHDPVASIGKVLGDRSVMYKYLNRNLALITTASANTATFHLLDSISGQVLHSSSHIGVDTSLPIPSVISENWFAYSFFADPKDNSAAKGFQFVISELYESPLPNDRGPLGPASNYSSLDASTTLKPHMLSQSFVIPEGISHMSVTQSRQGITTRHILCTLSSSPAIISIPRHFVDPRRPVDRDATSTEMEEGLFKYDPVLDFDPKWYLTHAREVMGIREVMTTPSTLESTSLLFAFGHDIFGTRVAPSGAFDLLGKGFSKMQLVITVVALSLGVGVLAPMVRKSQVEARWKL